MNTDILREFLSEDSLGLHHSYMKNKYAKYSILKKSIDLLNGVKLEDIPRLRIPKEAGIEAYNLLSDIESHKCYFNSFDRNGKRCNNIRRYFGSEEKLLYELFELARGSDESFLYIYVQGGRVEIKSQDSSKAFQRCRPILALDLCEHAYFLDYAFDKERYLRASISHLNLEKLDKAITFS